MTPEGPQIEFIAEGSEDCPLLQISGSDLQSSRELFHAIRGMRDRMVGGFMMHDVPGFEECRRPELAFEITDSNLGVQRSSGGGGFRWALSYDGWTQVEDFLAPFCCHDSSMPGFQWLDESSDISVLFSPGGGW